MSNEPHHYPPEIMNLLIDIIPRLVRSKRDVIVFFRGAGVAAGDLREVARVVNNRPEEISKFDIARRVLVHLNDRGDAAIRERREIIKRVAEFDDFSSCWPNEQLAARGLVSELRRVVNVKDSFTRMKQERDAERERSAQEYEAKARAIQEQKRERAAIRDALYALFSETDAWKRGKALEAVLNRLFKAFDISIREAFSIKGSEGEGIVEQIDGVIALDGHVVLVEMKWHTQALGVYEVSRHMQRVFAREGARGLIISASGFAPTGVATVRETLALKVVGLCELREIVMVLEREFDLVDYLRKGFHRVISDRLPLFPTAT